MKSKISTIIAAGALAMAAVSCSEKWEPAPTGGQGQLSLSSMGLDVNTAATSRADVAVDTRNFLVEVANSADGSTTEYVYGTMPEVITLPAGMYKVNVRSHEPQNAEWNNPYYAGSSREFEIKSNEITEVGTVTCTFQSLKVSVTYDDDLKAVMGDDCTVTVEANCGGSTGTLVFVPTETRAAFYKVVEGSTTMVATFSGTVSGQQVEEVLVFSDVAAGQHRRINYTLSQPPIPPSPSGELNPGTISVDGTVTDEDINGGVTPDDEQTIDPGVRPGDEDNDNPNPDSDPDPDDPETPVATFSNGEGSTLNFEGVNDANTYSGNAIVVINCTEGIANLKVKIDSDGLTPEVLEGVGLASEFDLAYPGELEQGIDGLGFPYGSQVIGQKTVNFNITQFVPLLTIYPGNSNFIITVVDSKGKSKAMTLKFNS